MNKKEFLDELGNCLVILEDGEQKDILEEYSQHIDMKVKSGLSEEEALRDFGSVKELAAGILEAYHVKAEFSEGKQERKGAGEGKWLSKKLTTIRQRTASVFRRAADVVRRTVSGCLRTVKRFGRGMAGLALIPVRGIRNLFSGRTRNETGETARRQHQDRLLEPLREAGDAGRGRHMRSGGTGRGRRVAAGIGSFGRFVGAAVKRCFLTVVHLCFWCIRWGWNLAMIFAAFLAAMLTMGTLFCFAVLIVCLFQGYPLVGVTVGCLGLLLCSSALTLFFASLVLRGRKKEGGEKAAADKTKADKTKADKTKADKTKAVQVIAEEEIDGKEAGVRAVYDKKLADMITKEV